MHLIYGDTEEELPSDMPKLIQMSSFFHANLYHDLFTGCTMTGILHLINQTPTK